MVDMVSTLSPNGKKKKPNQPVSLGDITRDAIANSQVDATIAQEEATLSNRKIRASLGLGNEGDTILDDILAKRKKRAANQKDPTVTTGIANLNTALGS